MSQLRNFLLDANGRAEVDVRSPTTRATPQAIGTGMQSQIRTDSNLCAQWVWMRAVEDDRERSAFHRTDVSERGVIVGISTDNLEEGHENNARGRRPAHPPHCCKEPRQRGHADRHSGGLGGEFDERLSRKEKNGRDHQIWFHGVDMLAGGGCQTGLRSYGAT